MVGGVTEHCGEWHDRTEHPSLPPPPGEYGLACEHAHSCCILLARTDRFLLDGRWHTHIDYERFHELAAKGQPFTSQVGEGGAGLRGGKAAKREGRGLLGIAQ